MNRIVVVVPYTQKVGSDDFQKIQTASQRQDQKETMTTTPWERIEEDFRTWIESTGSTKEEFNAATIVDRGVLRTQFSQQLRRQKQEDGCTIITLKYKKTTFDWEFSSNKGNVTLVALSDVARRQFNIAVAKLEFTHNGIPIKKDADVAGLKAGSLVQVENKQVAFSSVNQIAQALKLVSREPQSLCEDIAAFPQPVMLDASDENVKHAIATIVRLKTLVPIVGGCEATRRLYIDPILCAAGLLVGDINMTVEKTIEDAQFHGDVDYLFSFRNTVICVTEGKKDQLDHGIAQNIAQLSSIRANRKRKIDEISAPATFGIVTTFIEWVFIKFEDESILRSKPFILNPEIPESITKMIGQITGLLHKCKKDACGEQPPASRQKSNTEET
jgi:hypothetical protein